MKSSSFLTILLLMLAPVQARGTEATPSAATPYSIQVRTVPLAEVEDGMATYRDLRDKGYLAYAYRAEGRGPPRFRIAVGAFRSRGAAAEFGHAFGAAVGLDNFVAGAPVRILLAHGAREFVVTPSGLWVRGVDGAREVFAFAADVPNIARLPAAVLPELSPDRDAIAFVFDGNLHTATLDGDTAHSFTDRGAPYVTAQADFSWRPGWSPSGVYVAILDLAFWENSTGLWVARADGSGIRCLACNRDGQSAVRWFVWHPGEDRVLFVEANSEGMVAIGGGLYSAGMDGRITEITAVERVGDDEIAGPLRIEDGLLHYRRVRWLDEQKIEKTITDESIPIDAL